MTKISIKELARSRKDCSSPVTLWRMPGGRAPELVWRKYAINVDLRIRGRKDDKAKL